MSWKQTQVGGCELFPACMRIKPLLFGNIIAGENAYSFTYVNMKGIVVHIA
jgi:hypothetical protein